jgi:8-oxo-dGTP pyrophosphatase MutT (NUDIX family)
VTAHADALGVLRAWVAPDAGQDALRAAFVSHLEAHDDGVERGCSPAHVTASVLVVDETGERALLTLHRKAQRWFQLGGHLEPTDRTLAGAALREAVEESGITAVSLLPEPVHLSRHRVDFCHPDGPVDHLDVRFVAVAAAEAAPRVSAESDDVRWFEVEALPSDEPDLLELVARARAALAGRRGSQRL